jgi:pimeloyl-ACP methyl ester carboxylesterase
MTRLETSRQALKRKLLLGITMASVARLLVAAGVLMVALSVASLSASRGDVRSEIIALGPEGKTPALHLFPVPAAGADGAATAASGTVIVVHGFAGSKEFMRSIDYTLARAGFEVYGVDLPGHGQSTLRLEPKRLIPWFTELLQDMLVDGRLENGRIYLVGHSLGTLVVTKGALENAEAGIRGLVALSPIFADITPQAPANYLALVGESELPGVRAAALKALAVGAGIADPKFETIYGDFAAGTARAGAVIRGASHITIPDAPEAIGSAVKWLMAAAGNPSETLPRIERERTERGFGLVGALSLFLGLFYFGAGLSGLMGHAPRRPEAERVLEDARVAAGLTPRPVVVVSMAGKASIVGETSLPDSVIRAKQTATRLFTGTRAIPIIYAGAAGLATLVTGFLGGFSFIGQTGTDYLTVYFLVFAAVAGPLLWFGSRFLKTQPLLEVRLRVAPTVAVALGFGLFLAAFFGLGLLATYAWTAFLPPVARWGHILLVTLFVLPFAVIDEIVRSTTHDRTGFSWGLLVTVIGKLVIVVSWYAGLILPVKPQALILVAPILAGVLIIMDVLLSLVYNEHGDWLGLAVFKALVIAWLATAVFPFVAGGSLFG